MRINFQSCRYTFVTETFADQQRSKSKLYEQAGVAVTEIMNPYAVQSRFFASSLHFFYQKMLRYLKQSV